MAKLGSRAGWSGNYCHDLTEATSLTPGDSGKVFFLNSTAEFEVTLPSVADAGAGFNVKFIVKSAPSGVSYTVTEKASADTDVMITNGINELEVDDGEDGPSNTGHTSLVFTQGVSIQGDWAEFLCDGTNWYVTGQTKADGGVTFV